jgi:hypothetical protein
VERWWLRRKGSPPVAAWRCAVGRRSEFVGIEEGFSFYRATKQRTGSIFFGTLLGHECLEKLDI